MIENTVRKHITRRAAVAAAVAVACALAGVVTMAVLLGGGKSDGGTGAATPVTVTSTVTVTGKPTHWEEDSLPDEMYRWMDERMDGQNVDLVGPSHADMYAAGHHECWAAWTQDGNAALLMCPDGYRIEW